MINGEIVVDNFAGGGGASTGIEMGMGHSVDIAINHDPAAIAMHKANHPNTTHYTENVWDIDPVEVCNGHRVALGWFSPDCKHFSKAKGGKPVNRNIRGLSWVILRWAMTVRPRVIMMENVEEIQTWGPLVTLMNGKTVPDKKHIGETFKGFIAMLTTGIDRNNPAFREACDFLKPNEEQMIMLENGLGYSVDHRELRACDYGSPTIRKRFFLIARCDGKPIRWPEPTHGDPESLEVSGGMLKPWKAVSDVIDFSLPCPSIFDTSDQIMEKYGIRAVRPLSENTLKRIEKGLKKFVLNNPRPFIVRYKYDNVPEDVNKPLSTVTAVNSHYLAMPYLIQYHSDEDNARGQTLGDPLMTVDSSNRYGLAAAFITQFNNCSTGCSMAEPLNTMTAISNHFGEVYAFLVKYYSGEDNNAPCDRPAPTITAKDRIGLVTVHGEDYKIVDIGMRMLTPRELFDAQGFPDDYIIDVDADGNPYPKSEQVARCGNAVCPQIPAALVRANLPELCERQGGKNDE